MAERSKLNGPVEKCRPTMGVGVPGSPAGGAQVHGEETPAVKTFIDPAKYIGGAMVRQLARETALVLIREQCRTLARVMGLAWDEVALVLKLACVEFTDLHHNATAPTG